MKRTLITLAAAGLFVGNAVAQGPAGQPMTQEQMQQSMARQMQMMAAMFDYRRSKLGFDETVTAVVDSTGKRGWNAGQVHDVQAEMKKSGASDAKRMKVVTTCPKEANDKLAKASDGKLPPLPCRYTVFEGRDGKTYVVRMNTHMLAKGLQGTAAKVMSDIAAEEDAMLKGIIE